MSGTDRDRKLAEAFREAHRADEPPPFAKFWRTDQVRQTTRRGRRFWVPALAALVLVSIAGGIRVRRMGEERELAEQLALLERRDPLAFLLETPGQELLRGVPTFNLKGEWP
jgi:hypothetical protein